MCFKTHQTSYLLLILLMQDLSATAEVMQIAPVIAGEQYPSGPVRTVREDSSSLALPEEFTTVPQRSLPGDVTEDRPQQSEDQGAFRSNQQETESRRPLAGLLILLAVVTGLVPVVRRILSRQPTADADWVPYEDEGDSPYSGQTSRPLIVQIQSVAAKSSDGEAVLLSVRAVLHSDRCAVTRSRLREFFEWYLRRAASETAGSHIMTRPADLADVLNILCSEEARLLGLDVLQTQVQLDCAAIQASELTSAKGCLV